MDYGRFVGIVDARSGSPTEPWKLNTVLDSVVTAMTGLRELIGRPQGHWGITPIAIYAPLQGAAEAEIESSDPAQPEKDDTGNTLPVEE